MIRSLPSIAAMRRTLFLFGALLLLLVLVSPALAQDEEARAQFTPGQTTTYSQRVPINIVFVGYDRSDIDVGAMKDELPAGYAPIVRYPAFYGAAGREMGLAFNFQYNVVFADNRFEDDFFTYLAQSGTEGPTTLYQEWYNDNLLNVQDVTGPVLYIDAPSTEQWLVDNAGRLEMETERAYTVYFINWHGRDDFRYHVYTKTDTPDPDTGFNFGTAYESRKMIAWGGSHGRTWFYDLSAGPEAWTDNWYVDGDDIDGDGYEDYRMPPIWEYSDAGFRSPDALSSDLGLVTRFVAINLLFTSSPLYDPMASSPGVGGQKVAHMELIDADNDRRFKGIDYLDMSYVGPELEALQPYYQWQFPLENNQTAPGGTKRALRIFGGSLERSECWNFYGDVFAQLFCHFDENYDKYVPAYGPDDYVAATFLYTATPRLLGYQYGLLGFADDNWTDGTPSYVFSFLAKEYISWGYGLSTTTVHEVGHHVGLSHPHDGYDAEYDIDYDSAGPTYFAWSGDQSATIMSYIDVNFSFGTFDMDNMGRYQFAGYLNWAANMLDDIEAHPNYGSVRPMVNDGKALATDAEQAFKRWEYTEAASYARQSYEAIAGAADQLGLATARAEVMGLTPNPNVPRVVDPIRPRP